MSIWLLLTIISVVALIPFIVAGIKDGWYKEWYFVGSVIFGTFALLFGIVAIVQSIDVKETIVRQNKERQQIIYQIENLKEEGDKIKLNEWILTYNDWVNDVNTSKEIYGWASWYYAVDMSNHTIIELV